jgi:hypothetical protein
LVDEQQAAFEELNKIYPLPVYGVLFPAKKRVPLVSAVFREATRLDLKCKYRELKRVYIGYWEVNIYDTADVAAGLVMVQVLHDMVQRLIGIWWLKHQLQELYETTIP